jgi:arylsulfatase A-like enzyme
MLQRVLSACLLLYACNGDKLVQAETPPQIQIPKPQSLVLITIDTLRADYVGAFGGRARTPTLDKLARGGWSFENCISASMLTNPSHASIMTSLYPRDHGVYDNESGIADGVRTLAAVISKRGFRTGAVINFPHLNPEVSNLGTGFQLVVRATRKERRASEISREALALIDEMGATESFFLWLHYSDPHSPYEPPAEHPLHTPLGSTRTPISVAARVAPGFQRNNPWFKRMFKQKLSIEEIIERYIAEIESADAGLMVFLEGLVARGRDRSTAIVVTSDHGENLGEHDLYFHHGGLYRPAVHVPLIISVPGTTPASVAGLVESVDIAPTVVTLLGVPRWEPMRGHNLIDVVTGRRPAREFAFSEHMLEQQVAVRSLDGTLILHRASTRQFPSYRFTAGRREVYEAPEEKQEVDANAPLAQVLGRALESYLRAGLDLKPRAALRQDRESLRALGYIE